MPEFKEILDCIKHHDAQQLAVLFDRLLIQQGLETFILKTASPLLILVNELWAKGNLKIFEEHFLTRQLTQFLDTVISKVPFTSHQNPVLLATLPNEPHSLGLLLLESLLRNNGQFTVNLGAEVPLEQIVIAYLRYKPRSIFLSFSCAYKSSDLVNRLPDDLPVWIGGSRVKKCENCLPQIPDFP